MWKNSIAVGLFLAIIVFVVGYGRVLLYDLLLRCLVVAVGTTLTIVGSNQGIRFFVQSRGGGSTSPQQVEDVDFEDNSEEEKTSESDEVASESDTSSEDSSVIDSGTDLGDDAEIEELADMVSDTMNEDDENNP
jgi:hypothetical protein